MTRGRGLLAAPLLALALSPACDRAGQKSGTGGAPPPSAAAPASSAAEPVAAPSAVAPAAGPFPDGGAEADARDGGGANADAASDDGAAVTGCPREMARINRFCVDKWEAHLVARAEDGTETPHPHSERPVPGLVAKSEPDVFPQGYISRVEAAAACRAADKRLCTLGEWQRACRGKRGRLYPYGGSARAGACNSGKKHLLTELFGPVAGNWKYDESFNSPELLKTPGYLAKTGEYAACASEDGVMDLVGNLHEWVSDVVDQALVDRMEAEPVERRTQPWREGNGVFASGFFSTTREHGPGCTFLTIAHEPRYHDYSIGFRCCRLAAPTAGAPH